MKKSTPIDLHSSQEFRDKFFSQHDAQHLFVSPLSYSFFITRLEALLHHIRLPIPPVRERNHSLIWVTQGNLELNVASDTICLQAGDLLVLPAYSAYALQQVIQPPTGLVCHFNPALIQQKFIHLFNQNEFAFLQEHNWPHLIKSHELSGSIANVFDRLCLEYDKNEKANSDLLNIYLLALLYEIKQSILTNELGQNADQRISQQFKLLLKQHIRTHHQVQEYADLLSITANHLNKLIKRTTGQSPLKWITNMLVLEARVLLFQSPMSVNEIAYELGFDDQSYFGRTFKKTTGLSPLAYRKKHKMS